LLPESCKWRAARKSETKKKTQNHENPKSGKAEKEKLLFDLLLFRVFVFLFSFEFRILNLFRISGFGFLNDRDFHAVDGRQRVEQAIPIFAAVTSDPELSGRGAEVEGGGFEVVDVHGVALDGEEALLLGQPLGEALP